MGISASKDSSSKDYYYSSSSFPVSTSARDSTTWLDVITTGCYISIQSCRWTHERTALPYSFPDCRLFFATKCSASFTLLVFCRLHFSVQVELESVVLEIDWNEIVPSIPFHQFLKMSSHSLTKFAVNRNHVTTIVSQIEVLLSFVRDLCCTAQHLVSIHHWLFDRILHLLLILDQRSMEMYQL